MDDTANKPRSKQKQLNVKCPEAYRLATELSKKLGMPKVKIVELALAMAWEKSERERVFKDRSLES